MMKKTLHKINHELKEKAKYFFNETRFGGWLLKSMAMLNTVEGIVHLIVACIGIWGVIATGVLDFRLLLPIIENLILGLFSLLTGWALGMHHHHHHDHKEEE